MARVDFSSRAPIGVVTVGGQKLVVFATEDMIRQLRVVRDSVNAVETGLTASGITFSPTGGLSSTDVQAMGAELDSEKASVASLNAHTGNTSNPHSVTKTQVGLGNVDNTSDANKPVSTAQAAADAAVQAFAIQRGNHTGTQTASTISDFNTAADARVTYTAQGAVTSKGAAATLTIAELLTRIIQYTGAAASLTLPTGSDIEAGVSGLAADRAFEFNVINTGSGTATIATAAGLTLVGTMTVTAGASGAFRVRKTATDTYTVYRIA